MIDSTLPHPIASPLENECQRLWQIIVNKGYPQKKLDLKAEVIEVNHGVLWTRIDFGWLQNESYAFFDTLNVVYDGHVVSVTPMDLAKYMFLYLAQGEKPTSALFNGVFRGICLFFSLMQEKDLALTEDDYKEYYGLVMGFSPTANGLTRRLTPPAYGTARNLLNLHRTIRCLRNIKAPFELANLSKKRNLEILGEVVLEVVGITLKDYYLGGSFNYLGLDVGRHYIDHCANRFEEFFQLAYALRKTHEKLEEVGKGKAFPKSARFRSVFIGRVLTGDTLESSLRFAGYKDIEKHFVTHNETYEAILEEFKQQYQSVASLNAINKHRVIEQIILKSGLPDRFDSFEFVRSMLVAEYVNDWNKPSKSIFLEYVSTLKSDSGLEKDTSFKLSYDDFLKLCSDLIDQHSVHLPERAIEISEFISNSFDRARFVSSALSGVDKINRLCAEVETAVCTVFIALTGWRRSEYGFPIESLSGTCNTEILDNLYTPWRFNVNWVVPKTHGDVKVNREITSYAYVVAYMASILNLSGSTEPALYRPGIRSKKENKFHSGVFISNRIESCWLWIDFIQNYRMFDKVHIERSSELAEISERLRAGLPVYEFNTLLNKTVILNQYRNGKLDKDSSKIFDERLCSETKDFLKDKSNRITLDVVKAITKELLVDLPNPTPHAFRHIWAEAVLTRYRGDIGKVIRANFRHMDSSFFMAYLRNKEMKVIVNIAERTVINKIVRQYFQSAGDEYHDYAGGFQRYVSKVARMTKVLKPEDQAALIEKVCDKVVNIKANIWASCMLREGSQQRAKCAEDGVPQRRNAEPKFCLGCMHADISEMNYEGIVLSIKDDVAACRNTELPSFFKADSEKTVQLALKRIKELKKNSRKEKYEKYIAHLEDSLEMASWEPVKWSGANE